jgi:hypothetical protein
MDYRGVRYTIRAGIEPNLWSISIYPEGVESRANRLYGPRKEAELQAINEWLQKQDTQPSKIKHRGCQTKIDRRMSPARGRVRSRNDMSTR